MASPQSNPRRCYKTKGTPAFASSKPTSTHHHARHDPSSTDSSAQPLRKSSTFHSPKSPSSDDDPILSIPLLARRSPTCPKDLEDAVAASEHRIGQLIGSVDRSLSGLESFSTDSQETIRPDDLPVPRFMVGAYHATAVDRMDVDEPADRPPTLKLKRGVTHNRHTSDSGLGSSLSGTEESLSGQDAGNAVNVGSTAVEVRSGINGGAGNPCAKTQHALSSYACKQIQQHIITPILKEDTLKAFHPLIKSIPYRVGKKEITCLRDLEKVVLWLAPKFSFTRSSFVKFCEASIQCLHTTVEHLNESDRQRPNDRPYTNGYFLDLTEQVRQYAAMIAASRERIASGRPAREDDYSYDEHLELHGGLSHTGHSAELVRVKNGQAISLRTGEAVHPDGTGRSSSSGPEDDLVYSMARRKKTEAERAKQIQRCGQCNKEFKRPCDLTKHEKTHSRPWKCNEPSCKYAQYGWPTEKERDRHVNDKHSVTPTMYKCQWKHCPYESKRESNCKQHMEKAHGWAYVRSKNNGKSGKKATKASKTPPTPQMTTPGSNIFSAASPELGDSTSPYDSGNMFPGSSAGDSIAESSSLFESPALGYHGAYDTWDTEYRAGESSNHGLTPQTSYTPSSHPLSIDSSPALPSSYEMQNDPTLNDPTMIIPGYDWNNMDFTSMNIQLNTITPSDIYSRNPSISVDHSESPKNPNFSPAAEGNEMLCSSYTNAIADEGYGDFFTNAGKPESDFPLYDDSRPASRAGDLFSDLPPFIPSTWSEHDGLDFPQVFDAANGMNIDEE